MHSPSSSPSFRAAKSQPDGEHQPIPAVVCDLCHWPMTLPQHCIEQGAILGLLVCTACIEDQLEAQNYERTCEAH